MIKLYLKSHCPFCAKVLLSFNALNHESDKSIDYQVFYVNRNEEAKDELIGLGGEKKVPFIHDVKNDVKMYEFGDIINYLKSLLAK